MDPWPDIMMTRRRGWASIARWSVSMPSRSGIQMSSSTRSGGISLDELEGLLAALRHGDLVALVLQDARERVEDPRLVVHDQDVVRHGYCRGQTGSSIVKTA